MKYLFLFLQFKNKYLIFLLVEFLIPTEHNNNNNNNGNC